MTNQNVRDIHGSLANLLEIKGTKFAYFVQKNVKGIEKYFTDIFADMQATAGYSKYYQLQLDIQKKYAEKDENGNPLIEGGKFKLKADAGYMKELKALEKEYQTDIDDFVNKNIKANEILSQESTFEFHKIKFDDLPPDLTALQVNSISELLI